MLTFRLSALHVAIVMVVLQTQVRVQAICPHGTARFHDIHKPCKLAIPPKHYI